MYRDLEGKILVYIIYLIRHDVGYGRDAPERLAVLGWESGTGRFANGKPWHFSWVDMAAKPFYICQLNDYL